MNKKLIIKVNQQTNPNFLYFLWHTKESNYMRLYNFKGNKIKQFYTQILYTNANFLTPNIPYQVLSAQQQPLSQQFLSGDYTPQASKKETV